MSKKAAKKATKSQPNPKGKGAEKDGPKASGKDHAKTKLEPGTTDPEPKGAKRRVTVSVKADGRASAEAAAGETRADVTTGETTGDAQPTLGRQNRSKTPKRTPRIIAVPSNQESDTLSDTSLPDNAEAREFANSPFAVDPSDSEDAPSDERPRAAPSKNKKAPKVSAAADKSAKADRGETRSKAKAASSAKAAEKLEVGETASSPDKPRGNAKSDAKRTKSKGGVTDTESASTKSGDEKRGTKASSDDGKKGSQRKGKRADTAGGGSSDGEMSRDREAKGSKSRASKRAAAEDKTRERAEDESDVSPAAELDGADTKKSGKSKKKRRGDRDDAESATNVPDEGATDEVVTDDVADEVTTDESAEDWAQARENSASEPAAQGDGETTEGDDEDDDDDESLLRVADTEDDAEEEELSEEEENRRYLKGLLEALLFASDKPLTGRELARAARIDKKRTLQLLAELRKEYKYRGVNLVEVSGGFVLRSNPLYGAFVQKALALRPVKLSRAQLETLAIIAYRQPITRPEIDEIRGVDSGQVLKGLADRDLIKMLGKKDEAGRPMLYGTTQTFLELFSLDSLKGLPNLREFTELSEDSREKFAAVTGETIPGPTELPDETGETKSEQGEATGAFFDAGTDAEEETPTAVEAELEDESEGVASHRDDELQSNYATEADEDLGVSEVSDGSVSDDGEDDVHLGASEGGAADDPTDGADAPDAESAGDASEGDYDGDDGFGASDEDTDSVDGAPNEDDEGFGTVDEGEAAGVDGSDTLGAPVEAELDADDADWAADSDAELGDDELR